METTKINIAIVDDHVLVRNGVAGLMSEYEELNIVFGAGNGQQMQQMLINPPRPDVILMDINMPVMDGYDATCWLKENYPQIKVLALSMFEDDKAVIRMIKCGACGYVLKKSRPQDLLEAIRTVFTKGFYINDLVSGRLIHSIGEKESTPAFAKNELEFLKLCCSELTYKEIADKLFVSPRTVDNYRESLFLKLNLKSRTGLVLYAIQNKIFEF